MTARAFAQSGSGRNIAAIDAAEGNDTSRSGGGRRREGAGTVAGAAGQHATCAEPAADAATSARCSPDPWQHTDRYRLVTPFSLRL